jgi:hypothetical protein
MEHTTIRPQLTISHPDHHHSNAKRSHKITQQRHHHRSEPRRHAHNYRKVHRESTKDSRPGASQNVRFIKQTESFLWVFVI